MTFMNPVIPGFYPDPSICRVGEDYYLVNSSFHYFPGVPIFHSRDLVNWRQIGHCLTRPTQLQLSGLHSSMGIFAPTLRYHAGYFYMITTLVSGIANDGMHNFYVRASDPSGPWSEPVVLDWQGIDPSLFFDEDGRVYITGTNDFLSEEQGIYQAELDLESGKLLSSRQLIWRGTGGKSPEGPHMYRVNGLYYLMIAEGGTEYGHMVTIARSDHPFGPFEGAPNNPIMSNRSTGHPIQATGHADLVQAHDGSWWAVMLGIRPVSRKHHLGRETCLAPVTWSEEGWPVVGANAQLLAEMEGPDFYQHPLANEHQLSKQDHLSDQDQLADQKQLLGQDLVDQSQLAEQVLLDHFTGPQLSDYWNFLRNPNPTDWSLEARPEWLTLKGSAVTLNDVDSPALVARRQQHFDCKISTLLEFEPGLNEEAGLTVLMNERHHYELALTNIRGQRSVLLRKRVGSIWMVAAEQEYADKAIMLEVHANRKSYTFGYRVSQEEPLVVLGDAECSLLATEVAGGFTGVYFGLYATGNGQASQHPAYFDWFKYQVGLSTVN